MVDLSGLKKDAAGLVTVVAQDRLTGEVRMVAHANAEAIERTIADGAATFFSRSRNALWKKGETSGNVMRVHEVWLDCDADAVLYLVDPEGPTCHTGAPSCFITRVDAPAGPRAAPLFVRLEEALAARKSASTEKSYTRSLLEGGAEKIGGKIREEADELARAIASESNDRVASEAADVVYHAMVGLLSRGVAWREVEAVLAKRFGVSGHDEKAARTK